MKKGLIISLILPITIASCGNQIEENRVSENSDISKQELNTEQKVSDFGDSLKKDDNKEVAKTGTGNDIICSEKGIRCEIVNNYKDLQKKSDTELVPKLCSGALKEIPESYKKGEVYKCGEFYEKTAGPGVKDGFSIRFDSSGKFKAVCLAKTEEKNKLKDCTASCVQKDICK